MLTQLTTVKNRLYLTDAANDPLLTNVIAALSDRFDRMCNRKFARQVNAIEEFSADQLEICPAIWPIETVASFEVKTSESQGWQPATPDYLIRSKCVISLASALGTRYQQARVTFTGGYVLPGDTVGAGQTPLPDDIEQACVEQVVYWYQNRAALGVLASTLGPGSHLAQGDLLPAIPEILKKYQRMTLDQ